MFLIVIIKMLYEIKIKKENFKVHLKLVKMIKFDNTFFCDAEIKNYCWLKIVRHTARGP
jgi:hypothetical protein